MTSNKDLFNESGSISRFAKWLLPIFAGSALLYFGTLLLVPMLFGLLVAFVMYPSCLWLEQHRLPKYLAVMVCIFVVSMLLFALIGLVVWQLHLFKGELPGIVQKLTETVAQVKASFQSKSGIPVKIQDEWIHNQAINSGSIISALLNNVFSATTNTLFVLFLIPVYAVLFLYHRAVFVNCFILILGKQKEIKLRIILQQAILTYAGFIKGMIVVYIIVGVLNSIGLAALGIRHALLFGMTTAIMTMIPYVGIILSALLPVSIAFLTKDSLWYPLGVIAVFAFVQYLEANVIFPKVVGRQVNLSTWATLVAVVAGGIIWGISGMILFIPVVAILKIVAEHIPEWQPLYLLLKR